MAMTPWGKASTLKDRRLKPGPGVPRADVERNQRERLYGATVSVVAGKGYADASIAEVIDVAGVSRTTFYKYFADKEECFLATLGELLAAVLATTERTVAAKPDPQASAGDGLEIFVGLVVGQPDAARICVVESYAAGPRAIRRVDEAMKRCRELMSGLFDQMPERNGMPEEMLRGMIGSLRRIMLTRLRRHEEGELTTLAPQLLELALMYQAPPRKLRSTWVQRHGPTDPAGERPPRALDERLEAATMNVVARKGFADATLAEIAAEAGVSFSTFYATFDGKQQAFQAGLYRKQLQMFAAVLPSYRTARNWAEGVRAGVLASLEFLEAEPVFTKLVTIDVYVAGGLALERRDLAIDSTDRFIEAAPGYESLGIPIAAEAIQSGIYAMLPHRVRSGDTRNLRALAPIATYCVLLPFLGAEIAATVASGQAMPAD
jgi:AcrR family transcriptional regulator